MRAVAEQELVDAEVDDEAARADQAELEQLDPVVRARSAWTVRAVADTRARLPQGFAAKWSTTSCLMPVIEVGGGPSPTVSIGTSESAASSEP